MQGHLCRITYRFSHVEDRNEAILIPVRHRLDHEKDYRKQKKWGPVDTLEPVGGPGVCG